MKLEAIIEGLLFVVGEDGLTLQQLEDIIGVTSEMLKDGLTRLRDKYEQDDRGIRINMLGNKMKLTTKKEHKEYYQRLIENPGSNVLSQSALETLAIVAYNQPITRLDVDEIRGVSSSQMIRKLVAKGLVKEVGRSDAIGRPILYSTTSEFLDYFGLATLDDLPSMENFVASTVENTDDTDLYHSKYSENINDGEKTDGEVKVEVESLVNSDFNVDINTDNNVGADTDDNAYDNVQVPVVIPDDVSISEKSNRKTLEEIIEEL